MPPKKINIFNDSQTIHFLVNFALTFLFLFHLQDALLGSGTDFIVLTWFLSSDFDTPWKLFHIFAVSNENS